MTNQANFLLAVSIVGSFSAYCVRMHWMTRPDMEMCIHEALTDGCGWSSALATLFCRQWALDFGGVGPQPIRWSKRCTSCGGRGPHEYSPSGHVYTTALTMDAVRDRTLVENVPGVSDGWYPRR